MGSIGVYQLNITLGTVFFTRGPPTSVAQSAPTPVRHWGHVAAIWFSETDYWPAEGIAESEIGGLAGGTLTYLTYRSDTNALFHEQELLTKQSFTSGSFSGTASKRCRVQWARTRSPRR